MTNKKRLDKYKKQFQAIHPNSMFNIIEDIKSVNCSDKVILNLLKIIEAKNDLLVSYRCGKQPKATTWKILDDPKSVLP